MGQLKVSEPKGTKVVRDAIDMVKVRNLDHRNLTKTSMIEY